MLEAFTAGRPPPRRAVPANPAHSTAFQRIQNYAQAAWPALRHAPGSHSEFADLACSTGLSSLTGITRRPCSLARLLAPTRPAAWHHRFPFQDLAIQLLFAHGATQHASDPAVNVGWTIARPDRPAESVRAHPACPSRSLAIFWYPRVRGDRAGRAARLLSPIGSRPGATAARSRACTRARARAECQLVRLSADSLVLSVSCEHPKLLVVSDVFYPDGSPRWPGVRLRSCR